MRVWLYDLGQDVRYSIRLLGRSPGFSLVVLLVLALGIGANVAVFRWFRPLALEPVAGVADSANLSVLTARTSGGAIVPLSYLDFKDLVAAQDSFTDVAGTSFESFSLGFGTRAERLWAEQVTGNYFTMLGVRTQLGRTLLPSDDVAPGAHPVLVISDGLWRRAFGADPSIVGRTVRVSGQPLTVVGVTDPSFHGSVPAMDVEAFVPIMMQPQLQGRDDLSVRSAAKLWGLVRLRPGVTRQAAAAQVDLVSARLAALHPRGDVPQRATVITMWQSPYGAQTYLLPAMLLLGAMGVLVLLIVCANVSNLVLVRGLSRRGEVAARLALGASRGRVLRLLLVESLVLAVPGAIAGLLLSQILMRLMNQSGASTIGNAVGRVHLDGSIESTVATFAILLACACALVFGLLPAFQVSRLDPASIMRDELSPRHHARGRLRNLLVVLQVAVSLTLLVGAGLVLRSLGAARRADPGFDARSVVAASIDLPSSGYDQRRARIFLTNLLRTLQEEPGIESATLATVTPMALVPGRSRDFEIEGYAPRSDEDLRLLVNQVAPDYFRTLRIPLLAGRDFGPSDDGSSTAVAVVNETLARRFWGSPQNAIGRRLRLVRGDWAVVAGVVRDVKYLRLDEAPRPFVYLPFTQQPFASTLVHVRSSRPLPAVVEQVRARIHAMDGNVPVLDVRPLRDFTELGLAVLTMAAGVLAVFGALAALLAALGTYGMVAFSARQSQHEIGIRMAVGASRGNVIGRFLGGALRMGAAGVALGLIASLAVSRLLASLLYGVSGTDAATLLGACVVTLGAVAVASFGPAWRASRTDPIAALRHR